MKKRPDIKVAALSIAILVFVISATISSSAPGKKTLGGSNVIPGAWDSNDNQFYAFRSATGTQGILLVQFDAGASGTIHTITLTPATATMLIAASSNNRLEIIIQNAPSPYSSGAIYLGDSATVTSFAGVDPGIEIVQGDVFNSMWADDLYAYCSSTCTVVIGEVEQ